MAMAVGKTTIVESEATGTSNISALPNKMSAQPNWVVLETTEKQNLGGPSIPPAQLSQDSINQIVLCLQQASQHNLTFYINLMKNVRESISKDTFHSFANSFLQKYENLNL